MDNFSNKSGKGCLILLVFIFVDICAIIIGIYYHSKNNNNIIEQDVELQKHNDSLKIEVNNLKRIKNEKSNNIIEDNIELQKHNDSLKFKVNNLDSIKNAKVIEVKTLDNDSTIKLFYKLIK